MTFKPKKNKRLYNYLVNTLGISKESVQEQIGERVDEVVGDRIREILQETGKLEEIILNKITDILRKGIKSKSSSWYYDNKSFEEFVTDCVRKEVLRAMRKKGSINFNFSNTLDFLKEVEDE